MDALVPIVFFAFLGVIIIVPQILRSRDRARLYETIRAGYDKGQPIPPELVDAMTRAGPRLDSVQDYAPNALAERDLRRGIVWSAVGIGFIVIGLCFYGGLYYVGGSVETLASFAAMGAIPLLIGTAFIALWFFNRKTVKV